MSRRAASVLTVVCETPGEKSCFIDTCFVSVKNGKNKTKHNNNKNNRAEVKETSAVLEEVRDVNNRAAFLPDHSYIRDGFLGGMLWLMPKLHHLSEQP